MLAYVGSQADKMNDALTAMNDLLKQLPKTEKVLHAARENIRKNLASERITQDDIVFNYLAAQRLGLNTDYRKDIYEKVNSLTFDDIKKFHSEYISGQEFYVLCCCLTRQDQPGRSEKDRRGEGVDA